MGSGDTAGFRLGIDFGTWNTSAILRWPDGHARPLLFEGSPLLPSAVYADPDGQLLVGRDAVHAARLDPARLEPNPKRRVQRDGEETTVQLGDQAVTVSAMVAAVLKRVADEAARVSGVAADHLAVTLTHPAGWDAPRTATLEAAGRRAGLAQARLVAEPVAAAGYFVSVLGRAIPPGSALVVYDFGAGTFDASVVVPAPEREHGYRVLAVAGLTDVGGVDLDAALLRQVAATHRDTDPDAWHRLDEPQTPADRRHRRHLIEDVRAAKEMLSRSTTATVPVPLLELAARVSRAEFDALARPLLERTVATTAEVIAAAGLTPDRVAAILLVGGSSRIPLVAELLGAATGRSPSTIDQPETVVAEGSIRLADGGSGLTRPGTPVAQPAVHPAGGGDTRSGEGTVGAPVDPWAASPTEEPITAITPIVGRPPTVVPALAPTQLQPPIPRQAPPPPGQRPHQPRPHPRSGPPRYGQPASPPYQSKKRTTWPAVLVGVLVVGLLGAGGWLARPYLLGIGATTTPTAAAATRPAYQRADLPGWLPPGWSIAVADESRASVVAGAATNGGSCDYTAPGVLHVTRDRFDVTGCVAAQYVHDLVVTDAALEAQFAVRVGCAAMWPRTARVGFFVAVCADGSVALHKLGDSPPSTGTLIGGPWHGTDPANVVVGVVARGSDPTVLTVYVDGVAEPDVTSTSSPTSPALPTGHIGVGGFAPDPVNTADATITRFRVWTPSGAAS